MLTCPKNVTSILGAELRAKWLKSLDLWYNALEIARNQALRLTNTP